MFESMLKSIIIVIIADAGQEINGAGKMGRPGAMAFTSSTTIDNRPP